MILSFILQSFIRYANHPLDSNHHHQDDAVHNTLRPLPDRRRISHKFPQNSGWELYLVVIRPVSQSPKLSISQHSRPHYMTDYWIRFGSSSFHPTRHRPQIADTWRSKFWQILSTTSGGNLSILILDNWAYLRASPSHGPDNPSRRRWHPTKPGIQCHISPRLYDWGVTPQILSDKNVPHHQFITLYRLGIGYQYQLGRGNMIHLTNYTL